jgi:small subunit ribosomal protein S10|uniref:ribosomal protein S10 n=1 Tax=Chattonella marina TaxID=90936 RepID=UPI0021159F9F|nr:ribosomal protein S10 [Chattonella marina]UTE94911.1 ribosomal protein S10 [Chattonella marina]
MVVNKKIHKIRVRIQAFESKTLNTCCQKIISAVEQTNSLVKGPIPMPTKRRIYCVLRSPHVDKDSREHFEIRIHKKILDIYTTSNASFLKLQMPTGAFFDIKHIN